MIIGNWKMNGLAADRRQLEAVIAGLPEDAAPAALCPPATLIASFSRTAAGSGVLIGAQDCHAAPAGAHTGELSARQLADAGAELVILGHSERRRQAGESGELIRAKAAAALQAGLMPVLCVGESAAARKDGQAGEATRRQLRSCFPETLPPTGRRLPVLALAYEPVWAIGSGATPSPEEITAIHRQLRGLLNRLAPQQDIPILYGGSVKPDNAAAILALPDVGGALVGGASLQANSFLAIAAAAPR